MTRGVQDDGREQRLISILGLNSEPGRIGIDASLPGYQFELKSTTSKYYVSTARDVTINMIEKWRSLNWIVGCAAPESPDLIQEIYLLPQGSVPRNL